MEIVTYKKNIEDMPEQTAVGLMQLLKEKCAKITFSDSLAPIFLKMCENLSTWQPYPLPLQQCHTANAY